MSSLPLHFSQLSGTYFGNNTEASSAVARHSQHSWSPLTSILHQLGQREQPRYENIFYVCNTVHTILKTMFHMCKGSALSCALISFPSTFLRLVTSSVEQVTFQSLSLHPPPIAFSCMTFSPLKPCWPLWN